MGSAEKALEEAVMEIGNRILTPPSSVDELLLLLDQAETVLSRVEQSPSQSMTTALCPAMKGLTSKELLGHSDVDVKVAVASCISEITRITAPEAPYEDDLMKEIFQMIVESFERLDDMQNRSYAKRVSILETVAKVRSCVVMLDLECDAFILEMFHHFLKAIRPSHPENVFSSMEMIMTVVLEESEDISPDLLSCLLTSVKRDNKDILQITRRLAEKVIGSCAQKLKPCLAETVKSFGASLDDYSEIVASVCQGDSDQLMQNGLNISSECLADDSKLSVRAVSDEPQKGSGKLDSEVASPEEIGNAVDKSTKSVVGNGTVQAENGNSSAEPTLPKEEMHSGHSIFPKHTIAGVETDIGDTALGHSTKEARDSKNNSVVHSAEITDPSCTDGDKEAMESLIKSKGNDREVDSSLSDGAIDKEAEATVSEAHVKVTEIEGPSEKSPKDNVSTISTAPSEKFPDRGRPKRGRPSGSKVLVKKGGIKADVSVSPSGTGKSMVKERTKNDEGPSPDITSKEQNEGIRDTEPKALRRSVKKGPLRNVDKGGKPLTDSHSKMDLDVRSDSEGKPLRRSGSKSRIKKSSERETPGKHQASKTKQRGRVTSENNVLGQPTLKEIDSSPVLDAEADQGESRLMETPKTKSQKKRAREAEISEIPRVAVKYDESLVGSEIKVWWPDDEQFYPGVVASYDPVSMKHKVLYVDGDEEVLILKDEVFEFLKGDDEDEEKDDSTLVAASEAPRKKAKMSQSSANKVKMATSSKGRGQSSAGEASGGGDESAMMHGVDTTKLSGGRKGNSSKPGNKMDDNTPDGTKSKKTGGKSSLGSAKAGSTSNDELNRKRNDASSPKTTTKSKDATSKSGTSKDATPKSGTKSKGDTPKSGSRVRNHASKIDSVSKNGVSKGGSKAKNAAAKSGTKSKDDDAKSSSKSNKDGKSRAGQTPKGSSTMKTGKSDANGTMKGKSGASKGHRNEEASSNVNSNTGTLQEGEEKSGKKRRR